MNNEMVGLELSTLISALAGSTLGFLWWNTNPAKIIMGDVGSHFIGAMFPIILISLGADGLIFFFCFLYIFCLLYTSPSPRDISGSRMPSSA